MLRALETGVIVADPQCDSGNFGKRLRKYAMLPGGGYELALLDVDPSCPGRTPMQLISASREVESGDAENDPDATPPMSSQVEPPVVPEVLREWEEPFMDVEEGLPRREFLPQMATEVGALNGRLIAPPVPGASEKEPCPDWPIDVPATYERPATIQGSLKQEVRWPGAAYNDVSARQIVQIWRGVRRYASDDGRHPHVDMSKPLWRHQVAARRGILEGARAIEQDDVERNTLQERVQASPLGLVEWWSQEDLIREGQNLAEEVAV
eukprot:2966938-Prymnesium_polylepis.1